MGIFSNRLRKEELQPGDHIYSWRSAYTYAHHGIYMGDGQVIHFTRGRDQELGTGTFLDSAISSSQPSTGGGPCKVCSVNGDSHGMVLSCLDCFLAGFPLYRFEYATSVPVFLAKARGGTCTLAVSDPPELVLHRAKYLYNNGFGCYHIFRNNCEDFAIYCKTGLLVIERSMLGRSGQAASIAVAPFAAVVSSPLRFLVSSSWGMALVAAGVYCFSRYATDIGTRQDVSKVLVEDLAISLGWSVITTPAKEPALTVDAQMQEDGYIGELELVENHGKLRLSSMAGSTNAEL